MDENPRRLGLGKRLRFCRCLESIGVLPNWEDYSQGAKEAFRQAREICYPSTLYENIATSLGKTVFPRNYYRFMGNKIRQTNLFQLLEISHPKTRLFYGTKRLERIRSQFGYPCIAKTPVGSSKGSGVYLIRSDEQLQEYLASNRPAYIQEYLPIERDLRVILIAGEVVHAYWRIASSGEFRNNVARGASISYENIPPEALDFARDVTHRCRFDEVGLDICHCAQRYYVLEANMVYGLEGFRQAGVDIYEVLARIGSRGVRIE
jgi:ribosomal protein S6--L-glutamate ligase